MIAVNQERGRAANGLTSEFLAPSLYRLWASALGVETPWDNADQTVWDRLTTVAIKIVDENIAADAHMSAADFARSLFALAYGPEAIERWPDVPPREQLAWNCVGRHIVNCLDAEAGAVDPESLEPKMLKWFVKKVGEL